MGAICASEASHASEGDPSATMYSSIISTWSKSVMGGLLDYQRYIIASFLAKNNSFEN